MGIFSRINDIVQANVNSLLDKAENPEKLLALMIGEMEEALVELRSVAAKHIADQKTSQRKLDKLQRKADIWQEKAEIALSKGREDLARGALIEKQKVASDMEEIQHFNDVVTEQLKKLQEDSSRLSAKLAEAKAKRKSFSSRVETAKVRLESKTTQYEADIEAVMQRFEHYEGRIDELEAQVESYDVVSSNDNLTAQIDSLQQDDAIEAELEALKKKVA